MSSQVSSRPTSSITGPALAACPALDSQVLRGGERRGVAPCGLRPSSSHEGWPWSLLSSSSWASQVVLVVKNPPANAGDIREAGSIPGSGRSHGGIGQD